MLNREQKEKIVKEFTEELKNAKGAVLSNFQGLPTKDIQELRATLRKENIRHKVIKLTLLKRILQKAGIDTTLFNHQVPVAISFSAEDEIAPSRIVNTFAKKHENLKIVGGILDKQLIDAAQVKKLAVLPGKQELRGQLASVIASPLRGLAVVLAGNLRQLVYVLNAVKDKKA